MFGRLKCSFCKKGAHDVEKLVAGPRQGFIGPRVHICDKCVDIALRFMNEADQGGHAH
jgi:ATP-dependent protease Clp ATPase subunit